MNPFMFSITVWMRSVSEANVKMFVCVCFHLSVQVSSERGWDRCCLQISVSHAGRQSGSEAGLPVL